MHKVRGLIYFEGKSLEEITLAISTFKFNKTNFAFFNSLFRNNKNISKAGIFINGQVNKKYSSQDIVNIFKERVGLKKKTQNCDISIEPEDTLKLIIDGKIEGQYVGIRIEPPYKLNQIYKLASKIGKIVKSSNILVRTVESKNNEPLVSIDLITQKNYEEYRNQIENLINSNNLKLGKYTFFKLAKDFE